MQNEPRFHTLAEIYEIAKFHPFYRYTLAGTEHASETLITNKKMLYSTIEIALDNPEFRKGLYLSPSGGSTSDQVLVFPTDVKENQFQRACISKYLIAENILTPDSIALNLFGGSMMYRSLEIFNDFCEKANATTLPVGSSCPDSKAYEIAIRFGANTIMGFPSRLLKFARYVMQNNLHIEIEIIIFAGESLSSYHRKYLQKALNATRYSGLYGSTETGVWAYQPHGFQPDQYLFPSELMYVEIHHPSFQGFGKIIATNLVKAVNPLFRYDTGDIGKLTALDYLNKKFNILHLRGRSERCFYLGGTCYFLEDFSWFFTCLIGFQIQISYDSKKAKDNVRFCLVPPPEQNSKKQKNIWELEIRKVLESNDNLFITEVAFVNPDELIRSTTSQKVLQIVYLRDGQLTSKQPSPNFSGIEISINERGRRDRAEIPNPTKPNWLGFTYSIEINFLKDRYTSYKGRYK
jgi:phenylacetate-CoA ligase